MEDLADISVSPGRSQVTLLSTFATTNAVVHRRGEHKTSKELSRCRTRCGHHLLRETY